MWLILLAIAPIILLSIYIYKRDKYEKEPKGMLFLALLVGAIIVIPIVRVEFFLSGFGRSAGWNAFVVAAGTEELFKYIATLLLFFGSKHFNEKFDGIIYAVFVSLGFALVENILYVTDYGFQTGFIRAVTAVPAHTLFGVAMGYRLGLAKFGSGNRSKHLLLALLIPIILHGIYDYLIMVERTWGLILFFPFVIFLWIFGLKRMKRFNKTSRFNPENNLNNDNEA